MYHERHKTKGNNDWQDFDSIRKLYSVMKVICGIRQTITFQIISFYNILLYIVPLDNPSTN